LKYKKKIKLLEDPNFRTHPNLNGVLINHAQLTNFG